MKKIHLFTGLLLCCLAGKLAAQQNGIEYGEGTASFKSKNGIEAIFIGRLSGGGGGLFVENASGKDAIILRTSQTGEEGYASFSDKAGNDRASIGVVSGGGYLAIKNSKGLENITLTNSEKGKGYLIITKGDESRVFLGEPERFNGGALTLYHPSGIPGVSMGAPGMGGFFRIFHDDGTNAFEIAMDGYDPVVSIMGNRVHDYAEVFELSDRDNISPGTVVSMAKDESGLVPAQKAYDHTVVGVISGAGEFTHGLNLGAREDGTNDLPVALSGQVYVKVNLQGGKIEVGDLLVASSIPGEAMKAKSNKKAFGAVIGKALEAWDGESKPGLIKMLVMVR